jgi:SAM-dependent methyltransferase
VDELAKHNKERWEELVQADVLYSRPWLDLDRGIALDRLHLHSSVGEVAGKDVLVLAGGGGQHSAAFALLDARVTVFDLAEGQLAGDRRAAAHYGRPVATVQGDMRDLSGFAGGAFDIVYHPYSINFVPDPRPVFCEVWRVLRPGGFYQFGFHNPYVLGLDEREWDGRGYPLRMAYVDGEVAFADEDWEVGRSDGSSVRVPGPREFRHTLSTLINGLAGLGFVILSLREDGASGYTAPPGDYAAPPGSWEHFCVVAPPYLTLWLRRP